MAATATALASQDASPRLIAKYLAALKPILSSASDARNVWVRYLGELARRDLSAAHSEAVQFALSRGQQFHEARRAVAQLRPPPGYEPMHEAVDGWLQGMLTSCEMLVRAPSPLPPDLLERIQQAVNDAGAQADRFNSQRTVAVQSIRDAQAPIPAKAKKMVASRKEMRALMVALLGALLLVGGSGYAMSTLTTLPPAVPTRVAAKPGQPGSGIERRTFPQTEILDRLRQEIATRKVAFQDPGVRLVAPDLVIVTGRIQGPVSMVPVEVELKVSATQDGKPQLAATRLSAVGVEVPPGAFDALNKRIEEANKTLPEQVTPGQTVRRVFVEDNAVVAELAGGPPAAPKPAG